MTDARIVLPRRNFLGQCLALGVAPAVVRAEWLMPVRAGTPSYLVDPAVWYLPDAPGVDPSWVWVPGAGRFDSIQHAYDWIAGRPGVAGPPSSWVPVAGSAMFGSAVNFRPSNG